MRFFKTIFLLLLSLSSIYANPNEKIKIVIDPGHGGENMGALGYYGIYEKHITLSVSKFTMENLQREGFDVFLTRNGDEFVGLQERAEFANRLSANIFISIHCNASPSHEAFGYETFFQSLEGAVKKIEILKNDDEKILFQDIGEKSLENIMDDLKLQGILNESAEIAEIILKNLEKSLPESLNRGVRQENFSVLKWTKMPAVVVEIGFITNPSEGLNLLLEDYQKRIANSISQSIIEYIEKNLK